MSQQKEQFINIRDLVVEFRNKGKKFQAVKGATFDIYKGEIFGLVGESGSGKTTIGRALVGVQPLKDGTVYLENQTIAGKPTSLYVLNKEIYKRLKNIDTKLSLSTVYLNNFIKNLKATYENYKLNPDKFTSEHIAKVFKSSKIAFIDNMFLENLKYVNRIIKYFDRINQFTDGIHNFIPEISPKLEKSIIIKNTSTKEAVFEIKELFGVIYKSILKINSRIKTFNKKESVDLESLLTEIFKELTIMVKEHKEILSKIKYVIELEHQNLALSAPYAKREKFRDYYNQQVYVDRQAFLDEAKRQKQLLSEQENPDQKKLKIVESQLADFWSKDNINLKACEQIISHLSNKIENIDKVVSTLKNTNFENKLKSIIENNQQLSEVQINELSVELKHINKIVKKNIMKDEESIQQYNEWKEIVDEMDPLVRADIIELTEFLDLPSIDEIVRNSYLFDSQTKQQKRKNRRDVQMIFQDPGSSLNDRMAIEEIIAEGLENFTELYKSPEAIERYVQERNAEFPDEKITTENVKPADVKKHIILKLIKSVGLLPEHLSRYPHEFSGGQRQRVGIARSLAMRPKIIVGDEPISALDVSIRAQVLNLFQKFKEEYDLTYLFITHDLSVVRFIADRIAVIYHGQIVELADAEELFTNPLHPYTKSLLSAIPIPEPEMARQKELEVYNPEAEHADYIFDIPEFVEVKPGHFVHANSRELKEIKKLIKK
ncbi:oligopeptide ABC transporter ATP-binding protein OppF [Spiroplasma culicicola]|uniref:Oligopeptide ABC transporter ATP-binding protein n=1 Tax=Spiroplasma culicicola AES-1 TaxID=1276246 RepID=W6A7Z9_9MOLU|nr:oligopeptide ABC transporter ATP-binding protein OppF [Spiroplasma culicicola]AHI53117.1 oligopeptide ABC transporter ATP-binding protein [Spiroplasma culicicola AES-1]